MNLNGEHNDPSTMRARLAWSACAMLGCRFREVHVKLFINGNYWLYSNTEHIDGGGWKTFDHAGNLWKCTYPTNLAFVSSNPNAYVHPQLVKPTCMVKPIIWDDYSSLAEFIDVLNNTPLDRLPVHWRPSSM